MTSLEKTSPPEREFLARMSGLSAELLGVCQAGGLTHHGEIQRTVDRVAQKHGLRRWCDTRDEADYQRLIAATRAELAEAEKRNREINAQLAALPGQIADEIARRSNK